MKRLIIILSFLFINSSWVSAQDAPKVVEYYERHDQLGPFFMRWYWHVAGVPTTMWIESLSLTDDKRFVHFTSTSCLPSWAYGTWERVDDKLILKPDSTNCVSLFREAGDYQYIISGKRLYTSYDAQQKSEWAMKKR